MFLLMSVSTQACVWRPDVSFCYGSSGSGHLAFGDRISLACVLPSKLDWLVRETQGSTCFFLFGVTTTPWFFTCVLGLELGLQAFSVFIFPTESSPQALGQLFLRQLTNSTGSQTTQHRFIIYEDFIFSSFQFKIKGKRNGQLFYLLKIIKNKQIVVFNGRKSLSLNWPVICTSDEMIG